MPGFSVNEFMTKAEALGGISRRWKYSLSVTPPTSMSSSNSSQLIDLLRSETTRGSRLREHPRTALTRFAGLWAQAEPAELPGSPQSTRVRRVRWLAQLRRLTQSKVLLEAVRMAPDSLCDSLGLTFRPNP